MYETGNVSGETCYNGCCLVGLDSAALRGKSRSPERCDAPNRERRVANVRRQGQQNAAKSGSRQQPRRRPQLLT